MRDAPNHHSTSFLAKLAPDDVAELYRLGRRRRFPKGSTLFSDGDRTDTMFVLLSGTAKLCRYDDLGGETLLGICGAGELLGELAAIDGEPRSASGVAVETTEALVIPAVEFAQFAGARPGVSSALLHTVTTRLRRTDRKVVELSTHDTLGRVAARLVELADRFGAPDDGAIVIGLPLSQEELAGLAGASREAVVKALKTLRDRKVIGTARRQIRVLDVAALRDFVRP